MAARQHALCFLRPGPASGKPRPRLVGPDNAGDGDPSEADFRSLLSQLPAGTLDALTFHAYPFHNGGGATSAPPQPPQPPLCPLEEKV